MAQSPVTSPNGDATPHKPALRLSARARLCMVAAGYIPFLNLAALAVPVVLAATGTWPRWALLAGPAWLLLVPPVVVRLTLKARPLPLDDIALGSPAFLVWWFTSQWQVIFNRQPWIEETMRLVPGLYSAWLRLWGGRVGKWVYWTPGLRILDRPLIDVGDRVVFGVGAKVNPHVIMPNEAGELVLRAATVRIGRDAMVGGYSILFAGCWIGAGEASPGKREMRPFTGWANGRRVTAVPDGAHAGQEEDP